MKRTQRGKFLEIERVATVSKQHPRENANIYHEKLPTSLLYMQ